MYNTGLQYREMNLGDIEYIYIPQIRRGEKVFFIPPFEFHNAIISQLRRYPKNLFQLSSSSELYEANKFAQAFNPLRFYVIYNEDMEFSVTNLLNPSGVKVFFIHPSTKEIQATVKRITEHFEIVYMILVEGTDFNIAPYKQFLITGVQDFFRKLQRDSIKISEMLSHMGNRKVEFKVDIPKYDSLRDYNEFRYFRPAQTNYYLLNQILCNAWQNSDPNDVELPSWEEESKAAVSGSPDDPSRFKMLIDQVKKIDEIEYKFISINKFKFPNGSEEWMSPLIVVLPFNFPYLQDVLPDTREEVDWSTLKKLLKMEQSIAYTYYNDRAYVVTEDDITNYGTFATMKASFLDEMAFLHASFTNSPVIRFPHLGNSIKRELGFFKPEFINDAKIRKSTELIEKFGGQLAKRISPPGMFEDILKTPRQIVAISDLPIEWLRYKEGILSFTHDVARIPETPYGGLLSIFGQSMAFKLQITADTLSKTLVLFCATSPKDNPEFAKHFKFIEELSPKLGFKAVKCFSVADVIRETNEFRPELLIFDCHGGFDEKTLSSYLIVNEEKLTGDTIVRENISAPIVFLSACHTSPNYGYINKIADAFFEAGCLSITATYFPISIKSGNNIYLRVLNNLDYASKHPVHKNWLAFLGKIIRSSHVLDISTFCIEKLMKSQVDAATRNSLMSKIKDLTVRANIRLQAFSSRKEVVNNYINEIKTIIPKSIANVDEVLPEYAFYTHMGRPDLIRFKCWDEKYADQNYPKMN